MKDNIKILHFHPNERYAAIFVGPLIDAEKKNGYDSRLVSSDEANLISDWVIPYDLRVAHIAFFFKSFIKILRILMEFRPDIVISHNSRSSLLPLFAARLKSIPKRIYFNHGVPYAGYSGLRRLILVMLERLNCYFSTEVITVSSDMRYLIQDVSPKARVNLIQLGSACGIDLRRFYPGQNSNSPFRDANQIKGDDFLAIYIGRPNKRKGFEKCLTLWSKNFQRPDYKLILCGVSEEHVFKYLPSLPKNILCMGFTDQVPQILREANCLLLPSYHEGFSYAALEAMASGCLVLANNVEGIRNLITNHVNGILVDNNELNCYKEYIDLMRSDPKQFLEIRSEAFLQARKFSRDNFLDSYLIRLTNTKFDSCRLIN